MITSMIIFSNYLLIILSQSIFLATISLCPLRLDISLSVLSLPSRSLSALSRSLSSLLGEQREIGRGEGSAGEIAERRESLHVLRDDAGENHDGEPPLGVAGENHHDGEPPEVGLILLSSSRRRRRGCRDSGQLAQGIFVGPRPSEFGRFYKSRLAL